MGENGSKPKKKGSVNAKPEVYEVLAGGGNFPRRPGQNKTSLVLNRNEGNPLSRLRGRLRVPEEEPSQNTSTSKKKGGEEILSLDH